MKTVTLTKPLVNGTVTSFTFREPRFEDYMLLGDPRAPIISGDNVFTRPIPETVGAYANRLLDKKSGDPTIMEACCLRDAMEIQKVVLGFFQGAESESREMKISSSSSDAASPSSPKKASATSEV